MSYNITIKPTPEESHDVTVDALPRPGEAFVFDGMMYRAIDIIWNKLDPTDGITKYKPTILLYSQPYSSEQHQSYPDNFKG